MSSGNSKTKSKNSSKLKEGSNTQLKAPKGWETKPSKKSGGIEFIDPNNLHNRIRQMSGNPNSPHLSQQKPYVKFMKNGKFYDVNGNPLKNGDLPEAHITLTSFDINKMPKL